MLHSGTAMVLSYKEYHSMFLTDYSPQYMELLLFFLDINAR